MTVRRGRGRDRRRRWPPGCATSPRRSWPAGNEIAAERGILIADTKVEFGLEGDAVLLADEVLTPDSSRFWPADRWEPGRTQPSYDKQFVRGLADLRGQRLGPLL